LSRSKTEYLKCGFNGVERCGEKVTMGKVEIPRAEKFKHLGSVIEETEDIDKDIKQRIRVE